MKNDELMEQLLFKMHEDLSVIKQDQSAIKVDLKEHMRRTAVIETEVKYLHKQIFIAHGAISFVSFVAILAGIYKAFSG